MIFRAGFIDNGAEGVLSTTGDYVYATNLLDEIFREKKHFRCVCPPLRHVLEGSRVRNSSRGGVLSCVLPGIR